MRVFKDTPFEFGLMPWEHDPPTTVVLVFMKGTFDLVPDGECTVAAEQRTISGEVAYDDVEIPSVRCESDFALYKTRGELLVRGTAHAPGGRPAPVVPVSVRVGPIEKSLAVYGDRRWVRGALGARPSDPVPFTSMPIRWERAYGGPRHPFNVAGMGMEKVEVDGERFFPLPNVEDPRALILDRSAAPEPAGFAPIPSTWRPRLSRVGTYDADWKRERWPFFPRDFDYDFFLSAPPDQRLERGFWAGDETIRLAGLHPEITRLETRLPGLRARCFVEWRRPAAGPPKAPAHAAPGASIQGGAAAPPEGPPPARPPIPTLVEVPLNLDTITVDADAWQVTCVWRGILTGASDARLSNVERLFFLHEPIAERRPHPHYEQWLHGLLLEEAGEEAALEGEEPPEEAGDEDGATEAPGESLTGAARASAAVDEVYAALGGILALERILERPSTEEVREAFVESGVEPPEELVEPEPPAVELEELPRSALRLAAILRRRLGRPFRGHDWTGAPFARLDLSGADLSGALLRDAELSDANLSGAKLGGAILYGARAERADLRGADLAGAELSHADLGGADLRGARLSGAHGSAVRMAGARLEEVVAEGLELLGSDLSSARLEGANLDGADLTGSRLDGAVFTGSSMCDASIERTSARGASFERCRAKDLRASGGVDLTDANLVLMEAPAAQLQGAVGLRANFSGSNLAGADLSDARLMEANFIRCDLSGACFGGADLRLSQMMLVNAFEADFDQANLAEVDLRSAHLFSASFYRTRLPGARLAGATLTRTYLEAP